MTVEITLITKLKSVADVVLMPDGKLRGIRQHSAAANTDPHKADVEAVAARIKEIL